MAKRRWTIRLDDFETEAAFRDAIAQECVGLENIGHRMGVGFVATPHRRQLPSTGEYLTIGWTFQAVNVPAVAERPPEPVAEPDDLLADDSDLDDDATEEADRVAAAAGVEN